MSKNRSLRSPCAGEGVRTQGLVTTVGKSVNLCHLSGREFGITCLNLKGTYPLAQQVRGVSFQTSTCTLWKPGHMQHSGTAHLNQGPHPRPGQQNFPQSWKWSLGAPPRMSAPVKSPYELPKRAAEELSSFAFN